MEIFPLLGFIELKTLLLVGHLFGVALGAGVAFFSAVMFTKVMFDKRVTENEMQFLELASALVAFGLTLLVVTGLGMFLLDQEHYLASSKFLVKMTVVGILIVNGTLIHTLHIPVLKKNLGKNLHSIPGFNTRSYFMYAGGAISMTSWATALILGVFRGIPYPYETIFFTYLGALAVAILVSLLLHALTFGKNRLEIVE